MVGIIQFPTQQPESDNEGITKRFAEVNFKEVHTEMNQLPSSPTKILAFNVQTEETCHLLNSPRLNLCIHIENSIVYIDLYDCQSQQVTEYQCSFYSSEINTDRTIDDIKYYLSALVEDTLAQAKTAGIEVPVLKLVNLNLEN